MSEAMSCLSTWQQVVFVIGVFAIIGAAAWVLVACIARVCLWVDKINAIKTQFSFVNSRIDMRMEEIGKLQGQIDELNKARLQLALSVQEHTGRLVDVEALALAAARKAGVKGGGK